MTQEEALQALYFSFKAGEPAHEQRTLLDELMKQWMRDEAAMNAPDLTPAQIEQLVRLAMPARTEVLDLCLTRTLAQLGRLN
jgi:hypothetical protein